jgi:ATP-binding cassette subfamily F protein 3
MTPREISKEIARTEKGVAEIESKIEQDEAALAKLEGNLSSLAPGDDIIALTQQHGLMQARISDLLHKWETESLRLQELRDLQGG